MITIIINLDYFYKWICRLCKSFIIQLLIPLDNTMQNRNILVTISIVTKTIWIIVPETIRVFAVTSEIVTTTIIICWGYTNKKFHWGIKFFLCVLLVILLLLFF